MRLYKKNLNLSSHAQKFVHILKFWFPAIMLDRPKNQRVFREIRKKNRTKLIFKKPIFYCISIFFNLFKTYTEKLKFSGWSDWSECSKSCGPGTRTRTRKCLSSNLDNQTEEACSETFIESQPCHSKDCRGIKSNNYSSLIYRYKFDIIRVW